MASLLRNSRSLFTQLTCIRRTAATVVASNAGTQVKTSGPAQSPSQATHSVKKVDLAVRDTRKRSSPTDPIKPRAAGEPAFIPLVGKALNVWGQIGLGVVLLLSTYFVYINYVTNPEFYKSLKISREAGQRGAHEQPADREGTVGQKIGDASVPKGALNKHI